MLEVHPLQKFKNAIEPHGFRIEGLGFNGKTLLIHVAGGPKPDTELWSEAVEKFQAGELGGKAIQVGEDLELNKKLDEEVEKLKKAMKAKSLTAVGDREFYLNKFTPADQAMAEIIVSAFRRKYEHVPNIDHKIDL